jgi:hypothetical protein
MLLAASGSTLGASREIFRLALNNKWTLIATPYVLEEVSRNLTSLPKEAAQAWEHLLPAIVIKDDVFTLDRPSLFGPAKDRPILFGALAWADVLLTLDRGDFGELLGKTFYGLSIMKPGAFLAQERSSGRLR